MSRVKILMKGRNFSVRAILSTLFGETADSLIFITIAFAGTFPFEVILGMVVTQAFIKTLYEIVVLPFTILIVNKVKQVEGIDTFDESVS